MTTKTLELGVKVIFTPQPELSIAEIAGQNTSAALRTRKNAASVATRYVREQIMEHITPDCACSLVFANRTVEDLKEE